MTITIKLTDEQTEKIQARAKALGVGPEAFVQRLIDESINVVKIGKDDPSFREAAEYVVTKNAELYRRLS